jgi:hypothetical protein
MRMFDCFEENIDEVNYKASYTCGIQAPIVLEIQGRRLNFYLQLMAQRFMWGISLS